jgi:hypothetical protein
MLLSIGLAVVGLAYVRKVNTMAGLCFAGAGALGALGSIIQRVASVATSLAHNTTILTISQVFTSLLSMLAGLLIPLGIFMLANAVKQTTPPQS